MPQVPLGLSNIVLRLESDDDIGLAADDLRVHVIEHLRQLGFHAVGAENLLFDKDESRTAEFRLGAVVRELDCWKHQQPLPGGWSYEFVASCRLGVEWHLLDVVADSVVYTVTTRSVLRDMETEDAKRAGRALLLKAVDALARRPRFRAALASGEGRDATPTDPKYPDAKFGRCVVEPRHMPEAAERVLAATVLVRGPEGFGSGFFLSSDGLVLTAAHVVQSGTVKLRLRDGAEVDAVPIRVARGADAALLRPVRATTAPRCLPIASGEAPAVGSELYAAGAPARAELAFSLTRGILSGVRDLDGHRVYQTDAPISPGNSGGPLVDAKGEAVGVATSKLAGGHVEGVAFGIPVAAALAALGVHPDDRTDRELLAAPAVVPGTKPGGRVDHDAEDEVPSLDPMGDEVRAKQARAEEADGVEREKEREQKRSMERRLAAREAQTPFYLHVAHWGGLALGVLGAFVALVSYAQYDTHNTTHPEYRAANAQNIAGWSATVLGAGAFVSFYLLRPPLPDDEPPKAKPSVALQAGTGGLRVIGWF